MYKINEINIFIVEDNKAFMLALKADIETSFATIPIRIHSFETGEICMDKFKEINPQVVIIDYHLNGKYSDAMDGIKLLDWIKMENPETNVIILTGDDNCDIAIKSFKHGASDYVVKTETKFRKINYSLFNIFRILTAKRETRRNKRLSIVFGVSFLILMAGIVIVEIFLPSLLK